MTYMTYKFPNQVDTDNITKTIREESARLTDTNVKSDKSKAILLIGLTEADYENLQTLAAQHPRIKNYGVLVRKVLKDAAKR